MNNLNRIISIIGILSYTELYSIIGLSGNLGRRVTKTYEPGNLMKTRGRRGGCQQAGGNDGYRL